MKNIVYRVSGEILPKEDIVSILKDGGFKERAEHILWKYDSLSYIHAVFGHMVIGAGGWIAGYNYSSGNNLEASIGAFIALTGVSMIVSSIYKAFSFERIIKTAIAQNRLIEDGELPDWAERRRDLGLDKFIESD